jgi:transcriptional regulator NrdR family protein
MKCPACGDESSTVLRVRQDEGLVRRSRQCSCCGKRWATIEAPESVHDAAAAIRQHFADLAAAVGAIPGEG